APCARALSHALATQTVEKSGLGASRVKRLIRDGKNLELLTRSPSTLVFRPRRDWDEGRVISRYFAADELEKVKRIELQARLSQPTSGRGYELGVVWGDRLAGRWPLTEEWRSFEVSAPEKFDPRPDGTASVRFAAHYTYVFDGREVKLGSPIMLDIQKVGVAMILNERRERFSPAHGYHVVLLDAIGASIERWQAFAPTRSGAIRLRSFLEAVPGGQIVAAAVHLEEEARLFPEVVAALRSIGSAATTGDGPTANLAVLGMKGASPGSALEDSNWQRAFVSIGRKDQQPAVELRRIRFVK
ncbi:MAG: hypothetical protein ACE5HV_14990, partial [Acidobacteriota bacterium]